MYVCTCIDYNFDDFLSIGWGQLVRRRCNISAAALLSVGPQGFRSKIEVSLLTSICLDHSRAYMCINPDFLGGRVGVA